MRRLVSPLVLIASLCAVPPPAHAAPSNDARAAPKIVGGLPYTDTVDASGSTFEQDYEDARCTGEPLASLLSPPLGSVWYRYDPPPGAQMLVRVTGSTSRAYVGVYRRTDQWFADTCGFNADDGRSQIAQVYPYGATTLLFQVIVAAPPGVPSALTFSIETLPRVDVAVGSLRIVETIASPAGDTYDPISRRISFRVSEEQGAHGAWVFYGFYVCVGPSPRPNQTCFREGSGSLHIGAGQDVDIVFDWRAVGYNGHVTICASAWPADRAENDAYDNDVEARTRVGTGNIGPDTGPPDVGGSYQPHTHYPCVR